MSYVMFFPCDCPNDGCDAGYVRLPWRVGVDVPNVDGNRCSIQQLHMQHSACRTGLPSTTQLSHDRTVHIRLSGIPSARLRSPPLPCGALRQPTRRGGSSPADDGTRQQPASAVATPAEPVCLQQSQGSTAQPSDPRDSRQPEDPRTRPHRLSHHDRTTKLPFGN